MANGQFHTKNQKKKRFGVKIKNPLRLPVSAYIRCKTGAIRSGAMDGKETTRTIGPGEEIFVATKGSCELEVDFHIIRYDETGQIKKVGDAAAEHVGHTDPIPKPKRERAIITPVELQATLDVPAGRTRTPIVAWQVGPLREGRLLKVVIVLQAMESFAKGSAWIEIKDRATGKRVKPSPESVDSAFRKMTRSTTLDFKKEVPVPAGHDVKVLASSQGGITRVTAVIIGEEFPAVAKMPTRITEEKKREPAQEEEVAIPTLGDRFRELEREEVRV